MPSFNSHFNKYFNEHLSPYGFIKLRGLNAFGRLVNRELLHYIILTTRKSLVKGKKAFNVSFGVCSIYSFPEVNYSYDKYFFINRGLSLINVAPKREPAKENVYKSVEELHWVIYEYLYDINNENDMTAAIGDCFKCVEDHVIPFLDKITDLRSYVEYCKEHQPHLLRNADTLPTNDSLLLIKTDDHDDLMWLFKRNCDILLESSDDGYRKSDDFKRTEELLYDSIIEQTAKARDKVYNDPELYRKAMDILSDRVQTGKTILSGFGIKQTGENDDEE